MSYKLKCSSNELLLIYQPESNEGKWVIEALEKGEVAFRRIFYFVPDDKVSGVQDDYEEFVFTLGISDGEYYKIESRKLGTERHVFIHMSLRPKVDWFVSYRNVSHFKAIFRVVLEDIYIGGDMDDALPIEVFLSLIGRFPRSTREVDRYVDARIEAVTAEYLEVKGDAQLRYEKLLDKKSAADINPRILGSGLPLKIRESRLELYSGALQELNYLIAKGDRVAEETFQKRLTDLLCLVFPQYMVALPKVPIPDVVSGKKRYPDYLLIDTQGNVDVLEIKRAFGGNHVIRDGQYRENYVPALELSGTIMQIQKYIQHLVNWGAAGEKVLYEKYSSFLPSNISIKFKKPKGLILIGEGNLGAEKRNDFDLIRRQYEDIIDILTYEDFARRLERIISTLKKQEEQ